MTNRSANHSSKHDSSRRSFLKAAGIGGAALVIGVPIAEKLADPILAQGAPKDRIAGAKRKDAAGKDAFVPSMWLAILPSGEVKIWAHRSEMGTGIRTSLPMIVADELEADWERVSLVQGQGDADFGDQNTDGSRSTRQFYQAMRVAGAQAKLMLERAAAKKWGIEAKLCKASLHQVKGGKDQVASFGELAAEASKIAVPKASELTFKKKSERRYVGKGDIKSYDARDLITGKAVFGADVQLDGLVYAVVVRPRTLNGTIKSFDEKRALALSGVTKVLQLPKWMGGGPAFQPLGGIAVIATNSWAAMQGARSLRMKEDGSKDEDFSSKAFTKELKETVKKTGVVARERGDVPAAMAKTKSKHEATYTAPFLAHAPMEPPAATAKWSKDKCEVWAPTQNPQSALATVAGAIGMNPKDVTINVTFLGGGFGRKSKSDFVAEAALISKMLGGTPVRLQWTREDDIRFDYYHTSTAVQVEAGLDDKGKPEAWVQRTAFPPIGTSFNTMADQGSAGELGLGFTGVPWDVPNLRCEVGKAKAPTRIGWLRSVNCIPHAFAEGSFADELAAKAGTDRVKYLHELIGKDQVLEFKGEFKRGFASRPSQQYPYDTARLKAVLDLVAKESGWGKKLPKGQGMGICVHRSFLSFVAVAVEVEVSKAGKLTLKRVDVGIDCGLAINPDRIHAQLEGSAIFGATLALYGQINFDKGRVVESNFDNYQMLRMHEAPKTIKTHIIESDAAPAGVGEPGTPPVAPAICNAIFAATGKRVRALPLMDHDLSWK